MGHCPHARQGPSIAARSPGNAVPRANAPRSGLGGSAPTRGRRWREAWRGYRHREARPDRTAAGYRDPRSRSSLRASRTDGLGIDMPGSENDPARPVLIGSGAERPITVRRSGPEPLLRGGGLGGQGRAVGLAGRQLLDLRPLRAGLRLLAELLARQGQVMVGLEVVGGQAQRALEVQLGALQALPGDAGAAPPAGGAASSTRGPGAASRRGSCCPAR